MPGLSFVSSQLVFCGIIYRLVFHIITPLGLFTHTHTHMHVKAQVPAQNLSSGGGEFLPVLAVTQRWKVNLALYC